MSTWNLEKYRASARALCRRLLLPYNSTVDELDRHLKKTLPAKPTIAHIAAMLGADSVYAVTMILGIDDNSPLIGLPVDDPLLDFMRRAHTSDTYHQPDRTMDIPISDQLYMATGRWLKYADKHQGGWHGADPCCVYCGRPMPWGAGIDWLGVGYVHRATCAVLPDGFDGDSASQEYTQP